MKWLNWLFGKPAEVPHIHDRSSKRSDKLTEDERLFMKWAFINEKPECPDCQTGHLIGGPEGGCSRNMMCGNCSSEFCITFFFGDVIGARTSDAMSGDPGRAARIYGLNFDNPLLGY